MLVVTAILRQQRLPIGFALLLDVKRVPDGLVQVQVPLLHDVVDGVNHGHEDSALHVDDRAFLDFRSILRARRGTTQVTLRRILVNHALIVRVLPSPVLVGHAHLTELQ